ncbi:MAG TPA: hypothetical protein DF613_11855 [Lachnospiraceae bacterium]|nr:hypothetical protein [Lachnospiraceae bacterium]
MRRNKWTGVLLLICILWIVGSGAGAVTVAEAASGKRTTGGNSVRREVPKKKKAVWVTKNQKVYYYNEQGKKQTGVAEIKGRKYYFDKKGVQHTGWQKIKGDYYFFTIANGKKGSMVAGKKVNGVSLGKDGKARLTKNSRSKVSVMIKANRIMEKCTKPAMKKSTKLKRCFTYSKRKFSYHTSPKYGRRSGWKNHWERKYALEMFDGGGGDCYAYGAAFAFLANACGYTDACVVSSGGHGWAEVSGKVYDPSWSKVDRRHNYCGMPYSLSGRGGRPRYRWNRRYVVKI